LESKLSLSHDVYNYLLQNIYFLIHQQHIWFKSSRFYSCWLTARALAQDYSRVPVTTRRRRRRRSSPPSSGIDCSAAVASVSHLELDAVLGFAAANAALNSDLFQVKKKIKPTELCTHLHITLQ
jgi:hypothetical protein